MWKIKFRACLTFTVLLVMLATLYFGVSWIFSTMILVAKRDPIDVQTIQSQMNLSSVGVFDLINSHDERYDIWVVQPDTPPTCAVIFSHGWGSSRVKLDSFRAVFSDVPCLQVLYDLRGHGSHSGRYSSGGIYEQHDLVQIHQFVKRSFALNDKQIGWLGISLGASFNLMAAKHASPGFVIADSPFESWRSAIFERGEEMYGSWVHVFEPGIRMVIYIRAGFDYRDANVLRPPQTLLSPTLIIHSLSDTETNPKQSQNIFQYLDQERLQLKLTNWGSEHAKDAVDHPEEYKKLIRDFLANKTHEFSTQTNEG
jgi:pimeloyl-ACP methyl ester carboxylesterase